MATAAPVLTGIAMEEFEYLESLANSKRFEFTNGVVYAVFTVEPALQAKLRDTLVWRDNLHRRGRRLGNAVA